MIKKFGLLGEKLKHSYSPIIHNIIAKKLQINLSYELFEVSTFNLNNIILELKKNNFNGVNVTIPHKTNILRYLDNISEEARSIGAVNTILFNNNKSIGYNTDYFGFGMTLEKNNIDVIGKTVYIMGTGGASKAIYQYLKDSFAYDIIFITRNIVNAKKKYPNGKCILYSDIKKFNYNKDLLINCTPLGMYGFKNESGTVIDYSFVLGFKFVIDIIYNPKKTELLSYCEKNNIKNTNGLYMLVAQAVKSEEIWNDMNIKKDIIDEIYDTVSCEIYE